MDSAWQTHIFCWGHLSLRAIMCGPPHEPFVDVVSTFQLEWAVVIQTPPDLYMVIDSQQDVHNLLQALPILNFSPRLKTKHSIGERNASGVRLYSQPGLPMPSRKE